MIPGDLVKSIKLNAIGIVIEIFGDLDPDNPWVRVLFSSPNETYQWCKMNGLCVVSEKDKKNLVSLSFSLPHKSGSL